MSKQIFYLIIIHWSSSINSCQKYYKRRANWSKVKLNVKQLALAQQFKVKLRINLSTTSNERSLLLFAIIIVDSLGMQYVDPIEF